MIKCEKCGNFIPINSESYREYFKYIEGYKKEVDKRKNNESYSNIFGNSLTSLCKSLDTQLCFCIDEESILKKSKYTLRLKNLENLVEHKCSENLFDLNGEVQILRERLKIEVFENFLRDEKYLFLIKNIRSIFISYEELRMEDYDGFDIEKLKTVPILVIYNLNSVADISEKSDFFDEKIKNIINLRKSKKKTTYLIYHASRITSSFSTISEKIRVKKYKDFYNSIKETQDISVLNSEIYFNSIKELEEEKSTDKILKSTKKRVSFSKKSEEGVDEVFSL